MHEAFPSEELARRAALYGVIATLVKHWDDEPLAFNHSFGPDQGPRHDQKPMLPRITIREQRVLCNGACLDLSRRPLTLRLFEVFCSAPHWQRSRDDLLSLVYRVSDFAGRSDRYVDSIYANGVKLISRARILATTHLSMAVDHGIEWFVYDQERQLWCLYRLRPEYFGERPQLS